MKCSTYAEVKPFPFKIVLLVRPYYKTGTVYLIISGLFSKVNFFQPKWKLVKEGERAAQESPFSSFICKHLCGQDGLGAMSSLGFSSQKLPPNNLVIIRVFLQQMIYINVN